MVFAFYTLGCKVNQYETQAMEQLVLKQGHTVADFSKQCDVYVINTCSVTAVADKKNRAIIRRCRKANPNAIIAVCGCYPQRDADAIAALGVDVIGGSSDREAFLSDIFASVKEKQVLCHVDDALSRHNFEILPPGGLEGRTRAMLKVQDGCQNFCTYCIIPYTRGPIRSASVELACEQAQALCEKGYKEIVITGIEIASWGRDLPGRPNLATLLEALSATVPEMRLRLGSLEPRIVTPEFCATLKTLPNLCPHFHLSMQSGCDSVLQRMKRKYDTARYLESVHLLNETFPDCAITTDMIVAFPGETDSEFNESLSFIQKCGFADMHIFPYSRRPGTPADKMPGQLGIDIKEFRSRAASAIAEKMSLSFREGLVGSVQNVLFEETVGPFCIGHTPNYVKVYLRTDSHLHNQVLSVKLKGLLEDGMEGVIE
jgi:threonylcarbamoyladenosine tRNA methylthiotransferase MtaB